MNRRSFLQGSLLAGGMLGMSSSPLVAEVASHANRAPRKIIFLVSDGMSQAVPAMAEALSHQVRGKGTAFVELLGDPAVAHGLFDTSSLNALVTDSAAAATAWASGSRVFNGAINYLPDGTELRPIYDVAREARWGTGLVTTTRLTHATPAGFATAVPNRGSEDEIAAQYLQRGLADVLMGGGTRHFAPADREDGRDLHAEFEAAGYKVLQVKKQMLTKDMPRPKVLGTFWPTHVPYTLDHMNSDEMKANVPTLAEMTQYALQALTTHHDSFILQVEGGRVDHAAHASDIAGILWDQIAFDDAVRVALEYAANHYDTLVVVTSDHGNSNPGLNGTGGGYGKTNECFDHVAKATRSFENMGKEIGDAASTDQLREVVLAGTGIELTEEEAAKVLAPKAEASQQLDSWSGVLGQVLGNHNGTGFCGSSHTQDHVLLAAVGPGQDQYNRLMLNTDNFAILCGMMGVKASNPSMDYDTAKQYLSAAPRVRQSDWA